jgi:hypothetical protein
MVPRAVKEQWSGFYGSPWADPTRAPPALGGIIRERNGLSSAVTTLEREKRSTARPERNFAGRLPIQFANLGPWRPCCRPAEEATARVWASRSRVICLVQLGAQLRVSPGPRVG